MIDNHREANLDNVTETLSTKIRLARKKSRRKIETISRIIKIRPEYLSYIEQNKFERIPGEIYLISFIKNYAKFLEIDISEELTSLISYLKTSNKQINFVYHSNPKIPLPKISLLILLLILSISFIVFIGEFRQKVLLFSYLCNVILLI